nr:MAG TPA: effector [Microviridae sp.]
MFRGAVTFKRRGKKAAIPFVKERKVSPMLRITFQSYLPK